MQLIKKRYGKPYDRGTKAVNAKKRSRTLAADEERDMSPDNNQLQSTETKVEMYSAV
jgi:hypothetical protein